MVKKHTAASALPVEASRAFQAQFRHAKRLPAPLHRAAFRLATRAGDQELLALLVARTDAPSDLFEQYRALTDIPLRVAFLTRSGHTPEFLRNEIGAEKRAGVLKALVAPGASAEVLSTISSVFVDRPTRALAEALVHVAADLPVDARLKVLEVLASRYQSMTQANGHALLVLARALATGSPLVASKAALLATAPELAEPFYDRPGLDSAARLSLVEHGLKPRLSMPGLKDHRGNRSYYGTRAVEAVMAAVTRILSVPDVQDDVVAALADLGKHELLVEAERRTLASRIAARGGAAEEVSISSRDALLELVKKGDEGAQTQVITSTSFEMDERLDALTRLRNVSAVVQAAPRLPREILDALYLKAPEEMTKVYGFSLYPDPAAAEIELVRQAAAAAAASSRARYNSWYGSPLLALLRTNVLSPTALSAFPWSFVQGFSGPYNYHLDAAAVMLLEHVAEVQAAAFGDNLACWETFAILAGDFSGTIGELAEMVVTLTPEA